ncbi:MAG: hypothetical protein AAF383_00755 [Cyanobacteria bacterium P01_A01_bin.83]
MNFLYTIDQNIQQKYGLDPNNLEDKVHQTVSIKSKNNSDNEDVLLEVNNKGYLWIIEISKNLSLLIPANKTKSKTIFTKDIYQQWESLFIYDKYKEYLEGKTRNFTLKKPARVKFNGNNIWKLIDKGILNFGDDSDLSSSVKSDREVNQKILKNNLKNTVDAQPEKFQLSQEQSAQEIEQIKDNTIANKKKETDFSLESNSKLLKDEIDRYLAEYLPQQLVFILKSNSKVTHEIEKHIEKKYSSLFKEHHIAGKTQHLETPKSNNSTFSNQNITLYNQESEDKQTSLAINASDYEKLKTIREELHELKSKEERNENSITKLTQDLTNFQNAIDNVNDKIIPQLNRSIENLENNIQKVQINQSNIHSNFVNKESLASVNTEAIQIKDIVNNLYLEFNNIKNPQKINQIDYLVEFPQSDQDLEVLKQYNDNPRTLAINAIKVAATRESIEEIRTGIKTPLILKQDENDSYWILNEPIPKDKYFYLVPKANLIINDRIYQTVEDIFTCQGYQDRTSNNFKLKSPAVVKLSADFDDQWELVQPGELVFS